MQYTQNINHNIEFVNIHFRLSCYHKMTLTGIKNLKMDFLLIFSKEPSEFATFCTKFESDLSIEHQEIKKIRWVTKINRVLLKSKLDSLVSVQWSHIMTLNNLNFHVSELKYNVYIFHISYRNNKFCDCDVRNWRRSTTCS